MFVRHEENENSVNKLIFSECGNAHVKEDAVENRHRYDLEEGKVRENCNKWHAPNSVIRLKI